MWVLLGLVVVLATSAPLTWVVLSRDPLHSAVFAHDIPEILRLVRDGHNVNRRSAWGSTRDPFVFLRTTPPGELWLPGDTPLHVAAMHTSPEVIRTLLHAGADPTIENDAGETPLDYAKLVQAPEHIKLLSPP